MVQGNTCKTRPLSVSSDLVRGPRRCLVSAQGVVFSSRKRVLVRGVGKAVPWWRRPDLCPFSRRYDEFMVLSLPGGWAPEDATQTASLVEAAGVQTRASLGALGDIHRTPSRRSPTADPPDAVSRRSGSCRPTSIPPRTLNLHAARG